MVMTRAGRREWIGLAVIALPCMLYSMDLTVLNLAIPSISADLKPSSAELLWIVDIYGFLVAGSLITMGTLGDRIGRRKLLLIGAAMFGTASALAAFSTSAAMLITIRALQGVAAATIAPSTLSLIRNMFLDPSQRTIAISVWIMSYSAGAVIAPLIGGVLLEHFRWGSVFLINVPVMLALLAIGPFLLPEFRNPEAGRLDPVSAVQSLAAVLAIIYGLKRIAEAGPGWIAALSILSGTAVGVSFLQRQRMLADPLIDLKLFRYPAFGAALLVNILAFNTAFAAFLFIAQYLQSVLGLSPIAAGLWSLPSALAFIVGSMLTPSIVGRYHPADVIAGGMTVSAAGFVLLSLIDDVAPGVGIPVVGSVVFSIGMTPVIALTTGIVLGAAPPERAGAAAALSETSTEFGGALGIAVLGSVATAIYRGKIGEMLPAGIREEAAEIARGTIGGAVAVAGELPAALGAGLLGSAREAFARAFGTTASISAVIAIGLAVLATAILRRDHTRTGSRYITAAMAVILMTAPSSGQGTATDGAPDFRSGFAPVNGLKMYYEIHGTVNGNDPPLVLLHGGGSTIETSFGKVLPALAKTRQVIAIEQQGHGRTADVVDRPFTFEQSADDTAGLLRHLNIGKADFLGYSNGGHIALQIAISHPDLVRKLIVESAMFQRDGSDPGFWKSFENAKQDDMPLELQKAYLGTAPHPEDLSRFFTKSVQRMLHFKGWTPEAIRSIGAPTLVMIGDHDIVRPEHAVLMFRLLPNAQLAILPGTDHMSIVNRSDWLVPMIDAFLDAPVPITRSAP